MSSTDDLERDFGPADRVVSPRPASVYVQTLRVLDRMLDLLEQIVTEEGVK